MNKFIAITIATGLLFSCGIAKRPETAIYSLKPEVSEVKKCTTNKSIQIAEPTVSSGLETRRIVVYQDDNHMNFYTGARWASTVPDMLQGVFIDGFEKSDSFTTVTSDNDTIVTDYLLTTNIRNFEVNNDKNPEITVRLVSKLIDTKTRAVIADIPATKTVKPVANKTAEIIKAFEAASASVTNKILSASISKMNGCK